ncbi:lytic murein transglycosylase B [Rhodanobacter sp. FW510-R12]|uniref:lytic murein transglycosylase B n=1 Tax=unclassified Rhodanobacter TaxID=2621553 RepID=UPI0007A9EBDE|nr:MULTISPECIES: lytic murein transglycosylase B [unclassified Rhodanobacter]KZC15507.1 lytic murein transglycosylase B [Rhodanobacter sp. FW104-R8]KZC26005.1 lytic murein transglycosylase B [Rhodanobacter sp. FW510-T8]KZC29734.1 lytic murein transglycosylase B [Rhodanobacter sp. FW510-R10]
MRLIHSRPFRLLAVLCLGVLGSPVFAETHPGQEQLVREVAKETGKNPQALNALLDGAKMQQGILDAISRPAEAKPWKDYRPIFLTSQRIGDGIAFYREHRALLEQIGKQYGVAPQYIVAIVGVETSYGRNTGKYKVLDALVTLGLYYPPRAKFFREQLKELLSLPDNHLAGPVGTLTGSYAGAQGWGQFMPTSIRDFAVDADHDGRIDLQNSLPDIFASVANYFAKHGWVDGGPVASRAQPDAAAQPIAVKDAAPQWPLEQLEAWGYAPLQRLSPGEPASLQTLEGPNGPEYWFTFRNFYVITRYNRSPLYAMAVDQLAQAIAAGADRAGAAR